MKACAYFKQLQLYFESVSPQINRQNCIHTERGNILLAVHSFKLQCHTGYNFL